MLHRAAVVAVIALSACAAPTNLHGLTPETQAKVATASSLSCDNGQKSLPISSINDDYCDCIDGSDEPGTSACSHTGVLFHCLNEGYFSSDIPTSRVNDGICDCCDGSDEYLHPSSCSNTCGVLKAAHDEKMAAKSATEAAGRAARQQLVVKAKQAKEEAFRKRTDLESTKRDLEAAVASANELKSAEEALEVQDRRAASQRSRQAVADSLGLSSMSADQLASVIIDLSLKVYSKDDVLAALRATGVTSSRLEALEAQYVADDEAHRAEVSRITAVNDERRKLKEAATADADSTDAVIVDTTTDTDPLPLPPAPARPIVTLFETISKDEASERPEAKAARDAAADAQRKLDQAMSELSTLQTTLEKPYGPDDVLLAVKDSCVEATSGQYAYKLCFFGGAHQDTVSLGTMQPVDAALRELKFTGGTKCWNGPERSFTVALECHETEELYSIEEPSTCVYTAKLRTPLACAAPPTASAGHDEL
uniref:Glucosidase 2 subunit beta n=1 Tax=Achlya hypogyna TaxID=1202772 RepID=A0A0A7CPJ8_ACHHY|nr:secreted protein [Achlya hypogyna]